MILFPIPKRLFGRANGDFKLEAERQKTDDEHTHIQNGPQVHIGSGRHLRELGQQHLHRKTDGERSQHGDTSRVSRPNERAA